MKNKNLFKFVFLGFVVFLFLFSSNALAAESSYNCGVYFTGVGCSHCAKTDPIILQKLLQDHPDLVLIEYEIYQEQINAPLLSQYNDIYGSGLGIPLIVFNKNIQEKGDGPILNNIETFLDQINNNKCPLINNSSSVFKELDITALPGHPKIWHKQKILIKKSSQSASKVLNQLIIEEDLSQVLENIKYEKISPFKVSLSGRSVEFEHAIEINGWIFQWNGEDVPDAKENLPPQENQEKKPEESKPLEPLSLIKVLSLAAVDAVNPCALAVLSLILIAIISYNPQKRKNILWAGMAFVLSVFIMYLIYGLIIIKSFQLIQALASTRIWLYKILGIIAIILGTLKLRDVIYSKSVCKVNPRINKIIAKVTSPKGAFLTGIFVTIFLLPCTIGPYVICGGILSAHCLWNIFPLLLLYNFIFIVPMLIIVLLIYFSLSKVKDISAWQAKKMKYLDSIAGIIMILLGIIMFFNLL